MRNRRRLAPVQVQDRELEEVEMKISGLLKLKGARLACFSSFLCACAAQIVPGASTETDVLAYFGKPVDSRQMEGGRKEFDYSRGPRGFETWRVTLSPEGKVVSVEQLLDETNFRRLKPGMSKDEVDHILGRHFVTAEFTNSGEEVWSWRYAEFGNRSMYFNTHFDAGTGKLKYASRTPDPAENISWGRR
jgi:hypothetical protein